MRTRWMAAFVTLAILAATYTLYFVYFSANDRQTPYAAAGVLDLSGWGFEEDGLVPLDGEWAFYPDKLLGPEHFAASAVAPASGQESERIQVPGSWSGHMNALGAATYRLSVKLGDIASGPSAVYGLKTSSIQMASLIYVNGEAVGGNGNPAVTRQSGSANKPFTAYFALRPGWNEIVVQAANYHFPAVSGISESIYLGTAAQISGLRDRAMAHDWVTIASFLIMGLYFIGLFSQRQDDRSLLAFGTACVCIALFSATRGERVLYSLFEDAPFWLYVRVQILSALGAGMCFLLYVHLAFRPFCSRWLVRVGLGAGALMIVLSAVFLPHMMTGGYRQLVTVYSTFPLLYVIYVFVKAAFHKVEGSLYLVVAAIGLNAYALMQNLNVYFSVSIYRVVPFEPFLFLLMIALLMSLRFSNAFRQIEKLSVQLLKADKLKDDFLARTSHEFKSPLHGVTHIAESLLSDAVQPPTDRQREKLQLIAGIADRLSKLVFDILDFSKLKQGELSVAPAPVDVRSAVEVNMRIYAYLCENRQIALENRVPEQLPYVYADESRFSQIIGNLLDNAVKHTNNGRIVVTASHKGETVEISVEDTGEGIDERDLPHLFEEFKAFDTTMAHRGFGLGLSIVKQLVELQQGKISVASKRGVGTTFTFTLPAAADRTRKPEPPRTERLKPLEPAYTLATPYYLQQHGRHTVLIVDDEPVNLKVLMDALEPFGYDVIAVKNGEEALAQLGRPQRIDLVILDLMMPGMSGYEVCRRIRTEYTLLELPVLMVTAAIQTQDKMAAFEAGANDYLPKPFDLAELKARMGGLLALKSTLAKAVDLEVAFLQSQIKPHFLFNVLNSIVATSYTDADRSRKLTEQLSEYLRGSFRFNHQDNRIPFREEFDLILTYVGIEQARFKGRIRFEHDIAEEAYDIRIQPLLLQPLVENAIRHGIGDRVAGGTVKMTAARAQGLYRFVVEDDGAGMEPERVERLLDSETGGRRGVGLLNIHKRLKYEYASQLRIDSEPGRGTKVTVCIPVAE